MRAIYSNQLSIIKTPGHLAVATDVYLPVILRALVAKLSCLVRKNHPCVSFASSPATYSKMLEMEKEFIEMINTHRGIIFKVCQVYGYEKEFKQDLFQEIVLQLWRSFPGFRKESRISTWMYRVALNTAISHFRKEIKKPERKTITKAEFQIPDLSSFPDENENLLLLNQAIQQLTKIEKAIIMLYLEEKNYQEISEITGITTSNVGVKLNRIKIKLEKIIKADNYELR
jgi:RNA polymerase sigma-70 factor (ECF subfamily)